MRVELIKDIKGRHGKTIKKGSILSCTQESATALIKKKEAKALTEKENEDFEKAIQKQYKKLNLEEE